MVERRAKAILILKSDGHPYECLLAGTISDSQSRAREDGYAMHKLGGFGLLTALFLIHEHAHTRIRFTACGEYTQCLKP